MLVSVIIVSYNTRELTLKTLTELLLELKHLPHWQTDTEIIVVDNNSHDGSAKAIKHWLSDHGVNHKVIANRQNTGFAVANNQGIAQARGDYFWLLNSDTEVRPTALRALLATFGATPTNDSTAVLVGAEKRIDRLGIVAPQLVNPDGSLQSQGGQLPSIWSLVGHWWFLDDLPVIGAWLPSTQHTGRNSRPSRQKLVPMGWVGGTAMLIKRQVVAEVGDLDEQIFMYGEDVEFCYRARAHHWDIVLVPQAKVMHVGSASSTSARAIEGEARSYLYFWAKHKPAWQVPIVRAVIKVGALVRWLMFGTMDRYRARAASYRQLWQTL